MLGDSLYPNLRYSVVALVVCLCFSVEESVVELQGTNSSVQRRSTLEKTPPDSYVPIIRSSSYPTLLCLQLSLRALIMWMTTSCKLQFVFHNLRKLAHTLQYLSPRRRVQTRLPVPASFLVTQDGPTLLCWET